MLLRDEWADLDADGVLSGNFSFGETAQGERRSWFCGECYWISRASEDIAGEGGNGCCFEGGRSEEVMALGW
jgi:hypothetical protein